MKDIDLNKIAIAIEVQEAEKARLYERIALIDEQINSFRQMLQQKNNNPTPTNQLHFNTLEQNDDYNIDDSWVDKVWYCLKREQRFLHSREIQKIITEKEPNQAKDKKLLQRRVGGALARLKDDKSVIPYKAGETNLSVFWGAPDWVDADGKIKNEYAFDKKYLEEKKNKRRTL